MALRYVSEFVALVILMFRCGRRGLVVSGQLVF